LPLRESCQSKYPIYLHNASPNPISPDSDNTENEYSPEMKEMHALESEISNNRRRKQKIM
jgi:hypothetical protein